MRGPPGQRGAFALWSLSAHKRASNGEGTRTVQALIELIAGFVALLASLTLSQFGVDMHPPRAPVQEIRRVDDCRDLPSASSVAAAPVDRRC